ncbi:MAG TPA: hypothetical protein VE444_04695, partial [Gaiellaceae bacterium]|nr:hypothetical protein [Gaiellaceae bacterium]
MFDVAVRLQPARGAATRIRRFAAFERPSAKRELARQRVECVTDFASLDEQATAREIVDGLGGAVETQRFAHFGREELEQ